MKLTKLCAVLAATCMVGAAFAQAVTVAEPWARATVQGQKATGAFMKITSKDGAKLISASSPAAGVTEIHEMKMDKDVMKMAAVPALDIPAGKTVELKPGGYHVMLMDLKAPLADKANVPITLVFENAKGVKSQVELQVPVKTMGMQHEHKHDHKHDHKH
jgi:copper(I)-binding protein